MAINRTLKAISFLLTAAVLLAFAACNNLIVPTAAGDPSPTATDFTTPSPTSSVEPTPVEPETIDNISLYGTTSCEISGNKLMLSWNNGENVKSLELDENSITYYNTNNLQNVCYLSERVSAVIRLGKSLGVFISKDMGDSWKTYEIDASKDYSSWNAQCIGFCSTVDGWLIVSGENAMGTAIANIYLTHDGGETWEMVYNERTEYIIGAGFQSNEVGFISHRYATTKHGSIHRTIDGGNTWIEIDFNLPSEFSNYYATPLSPVFNGNEGKYPIIVRNGEAEGSKDYDERTVFLVTHDGGTTWEYDS